MKQLNNIRKNSNKNAFTLIELIIVIVIIVILAAMSQPNIHHGNRARARQRACFSNLRVLQGAIEMYNMDNVTMMDTALPNGDFGDHEEMLVQGHYLKDYLVPVEEDCAYGFIDMTGTGTAFCKKHGTLESKDEDNPIIPEYDKSLEKPFSFAYKENKKRIQREKEYRKMLETTKEILKSPPFLIFAVVFIIIFTLMIGGKKKQKSS